MTRPSLRWSAASIRAGALACGVLLIAPGCRESPSDDESTRVGPELVTFNEHIAPIIFGVCAGCHRPGESAPFSLLSYDDVVKRAQLIAALTEIRFMPPWQPEFGYGEFVGERHLSDEQIDRIQRWVSQGSPEGEEVDLPPLPKWKSGWQLGEPDLVIEMPEPFLLPADGVDVFRNFVIPIPIDGERFVRAIELRPGNKRIVHHAIMRVDSTGASRRLAQATPEPGFEGMDMGASRAPDGRFLGWTPGRVPLPEGDEMAWRLRGPADLVLQLHMLPSGKPETIQSRVGFFFTDRAPTHQFHTIELDFRDIDIPPGETDYRLADRLSIPVDLEVHSLYPHAHYLGKEMKVFATLPDGDIRWLLWIKAWDFNWQDEYRFVEPVRLPAGSVLHVEFSYDNSAGHQAWVAWIAGSGVG